MTSLMTDPPVNTLLHVETIHIGNRSPRISSRKHVVFLLLLLYTTKKTLTSFNVGFWLLTISHLL